MKSAILLFVLGAQIASPGFAQTVADETAVAAAISAVKKVDLNGTGHTEGVAAMKILNTVKAQQIPQLLEALDGSNPISANWIRAAIERAASRSAEFPTDAVKKYFRDPSQDPNGRSLAWQMLCQRDPEFREQTIGDLPTDSSLRLREIGVAKLIGDAMAIGDADTLSPADKKKKLDILKDALQHARDVKQIQKIAKATAPLGLKVSLREHLGFLDRWHLVAPFDNKDEKGFDTAFAPESRVSEFDDSASFSAGEETLSWQPATTTHNTGVVDLNSLIGKQKGVIAYAAATFESSVDGAAEVRIGTPNAHKIWLNGELVMSNEIYHNSNSIDKFSAPVTLKRGSNVVLLKICQNEQTQPWAQDWSFQIRFCDATGKAIR